MKEKGQIRKDWAELLKKRDCKDMSEYFTNIIFNEDWPLDRDFVVELLKMAKNSNIPSDGLCKDLKRDIDHYLNKYGI
jgi:hypothetical protein